MAYSLNPRLFLEDGPTALAARTRSASVAFRAWKRLADEDRLQLVDRTLKSPANDLIDEYPIAL